MEVNMAKTTTQPVQSQPKNEYRYYCDACTGIAFLSKGRKPEPAPTHCEKCGMPLGPLKYHNFIKL